MRVGRAAAAVLLRPGEPRVAALVERAAPRADLGPFEPGRATAVAAQLVREVRVQPLAQPGAERCLVGRVAEVHAATLTEPCPRPAVRQRLAASASIAAASSSGRKPNGPSPPWKAIRPSRPIR